MVDLTLLYCFYNKYVHIVTVFMNFARSKFFGSLVRKKNFAWYEKQFSSLDTYFVKGGRIPPFYLNELEEKSEATIILGKFVNKP